MAKKKAAEIENKIQALQEGWQRTQADFENYRKRVESSRQDSINFIKADFFTKITPVLDNFRRAFLHAPADEFSQGIKQIEKQLEDILVTEGLEKISANIGEQFNPAFHEAVTHETNKKIPADHIIAELESGWMFSNRVLKPAKVRVSKGH